MRSKTGLTTTTRTPDDRCPNCGEELGAMTGIGNDRPSPGSVAICVLCSAINIVGDDMKIRAATEDELAAMAGNPKLKLMLAAAARMRKRRGGVMKVNAG